MEVSQALTDSPNSLFYISPVAQKITCNSSSLLFTTNNYMVIILGCKLQDAFAFCMIHGGEKHSVSVNVVMLFMPQYTDDAFEVLISC